MWLKCIVSSGTSLLPLFVRVVGISGKSTVIFAYWTSRWRWRQRCGHSWGPPELFLVLLDWDGATISRWVKFLVHVYDWWTGSSCSGQIPPWGRYVGCFQLGMELFTGEIFIPLVLSKFMSQFKWSGMWYCGWRLSLARYFLQKSASKIPRIVSPMVRWNYWWRYGGGLLNCFLLFGGEIGPSDCISSEFSPILVSVDTFVTASHGVGGGGLGW